MVDDKQLGFRSGKGTTVFTDSSGSVRTSRQPGHFQASIRS